MSESNWENSSDWRDKEPTEKQFRMLHAIVSEMISNMNRGQVSDLISRMQGNDIYTKLKEDLKQKNRSWKWKEDLK